MIFDLAAIVFFAYAKGYTLPAAIRAINVPLAFCCTIMAIASARGML